MPTPAQAYLANLIAQYPLPMPQEVRLQELLEEWNIERDEVDSALHNRVTYLLEQLEPTLPPPIQALIASGDLVAVEIGNTVPNAHMIPLEGDQFVVVMHSGLFEFLYRIARPLASAVFRMQDAAGPGIDDPEFTRVVAEIFWWREVTGEMFGPEYIVTDHQKTLANLLAMRAERFLLAHELGHISVALSSPGILDETEEESVADMAALTCTMLASTLSNNEAEDPTWAMLTYAGAELALQIWNIMSRLNLEFLHGVHPPAMERIGVLRKTLRTFCDSDATYDTITMAAIVIERAFTQVHQIIDQPEGHAEMFERQAKLLVLDLGRLLEECSVDVTPDYARFYEAAPRLFSRGYPEQVIEEVLMQAVDGMRDTIAKVREGTFIDSNSRAFKQYKLLFGITEHLPEPVRLVFTHYLSLD
jgi:hypothetical protein